MEKEKIYEYEEYKENYSVLRKKKFSIKDTGLTYRIINNWSEKGLISHLREKEGKWHRLNALELIEIHIYKELKEIGFSIEKIKKVKEDFYKIYLEHKVIIKNEIHFIGVSYLEENITNVLQGENLFLAIFKDGGAIFLEDNHLIEFLVRKTEMEKNLEVVFKKSIVILNMKTILKSVGLDSELSDKKSSSVFRMLFEKNKEHKEISISKISGEINRIKTTTHRKLEKGENPNRLIKKPNQKTTFFTNNNGDMGVQIEEEIK